MKAMLKAIKESLGNRVWVRPVGGSTQAIVTNGIAVGWITYSFFAERELFLTPIQALAWHATRGVPELAEKPEGFPVKPVTRLIDNLPDMPAVYCGDLDAKALCALVKWATSRDDHTVLTLQPGEGVLRATLTGPGIVTCELHFSCDRLTPSEKLWRCTVPHMSRLLTPTSKLTLVEGTLPLALIHDTVAGIPRQYLLAMSVR